MKHNSGFTLIQMSIVLVIIGLLVGGVLVGQNLIQAAAISAQISQISKYQQAVINFQTKYNGYLPGDIPNPYATNYGFQTRGQWQGEGNGDGILTGNCSNTQWSGDGSQQGSGELAVFWQDLSTAGLIDTHIGTGANYPNISAPTNTSLSSTPSIYNWLPTAKLGQGNFVYVMSLNNINYFVVQLVSNIGWDLESTGTVGSGANAMTVQQAYSIDTKIDDGLPQSGSVTACGDDYDVYQALGGYPIMAAWAAGKGLAGAGGNNCVPTTSSTPYLSTNCYDNNNVAGTETYSIAKNANAMNCALSFQFQTQ